MNGLKLGALALLALASVSANATVIESTYSVDANSSDPGLVIQTQDHSANPFSYDLAVGESVTFGLFDIWTNENSLDTGFFSCGDDCDRLPISVAFGFLAPDVGQGSINGQTYGNFTGFLDLAQEGRVSWDGPLSFGFGPNSDGLLRVSLSDENFNKGYFGLDEGRGSGATVNATLTLVSDASAADVPEPGALGLFGLALAAIGFATYRRRSMPL
ncbi:PEP-CTERM sorting domain-containing protein [Salinisphaera sp.]|uniref:PEP-CTERM sorting domain-containing protein n=1 Tax=Salinisphaera sp. TaxID=1914330 RepID=UPI002D778ED4|nr:PEP-CTERM sorting domain-containing protein [Salinisphaera sp.]HET7314191.1 PEP-CTERM sorting domain-containing protein [Salinisphaera sp.]